MNSNTRAANYLLDLGMLLREMALEAKKTSIENESEYDLGRVMAYYEVISLMQQQAKTFEIELSDLNMEEFDPDQKLL